MVSETTAIRPRYFDMRASYAAEFSALFKSS